MRRTLVPILLLLTAALAGCAGGGADGGGGGGDGGDGGGDGDPTDSIPVPVWHVGLSWTWNPSDSDPFDLVVTAVEGGNYILDTTDEQLAFEEAEFDTPIVGAVRAHDLALFTNDGGTTVWWNWPLTDGKTGQVTWFGSTYATVHHELDDGRFHSQATRDDGSLYLEYYYDPDVAWFDEFQFYDTEGEPTIGVDIVRNPDHTGEVVRADVSTLVEIAGTGTTVQGDTLDVAGRGDAAVYASLFVSCTQGVALYGIGPIENAAAPPPIAVSDDGYGGGGPCPVSDGFYGLLGDELDLGAWGYVMDIASPDAVWGLTAWLAEYERFNVAP